MLDIKTWLASAGEPVGEVAFPSGDAPPLPHILYLDSIERAGGDMRNLYRRHSLTVERYSEIDDDNAELEALFDAAALKYRKEKQWVIEEECYMTVYDFETAITERDEI